MSCVLNDLHVGGFKTEDELSNFEGLINELVRLGKLIELGIKHDARFFEVRYRCNLCDAVWVLSFPDQAYRGEWYEE